MAKASIKPACKVCGNIGEPSRPLANCQLCGRLTCAIGFELDEYQAALAKAKRGHRKIKVTCTKCIAKGLKNADTD